MRMHIMPLSFGYDTPDPDEPINVRNHLFETQGMAYRLLDSVRALKDLSCSRERWAWNFSDDEFRLGMEVVKVLVDELPSMMDEAVEGWKALKDREEANERE